MINVSTLILGSDSIGPGGLFDINATLPLVGIQFLLLEFILTIILYKPLLKIINERNEYVLTNLTQAATLISKATCLNLQYDKYLKIIRSNVQFDVLRAQEIYNNVVTIELDFSQKYLDRILNLMIDDVDCKKNSTLQNLENDIESLSIEINKKLVI